MFRSTIAMVNEQGLIKAILCDDDSISNYTISQILRTHYKTYKKVKDLIKGGNILRLGKTPNTTFYVSKNPVENIFYNIGPLITFSEDNNSDTVYLFDYDETWKFLTINDMFKDL